MLMRLLLGMTLLVGCAGLTPPRSVITTDESGIRTFSWTRESNGILHACGSSLAEGLRGRLVGAQNETEPAWLLDPGGRRLYVVWPEGYWVQFEPEVALYERSVRLAQAGDEIHLMDVDPGSASGTFDDPYIASGRVFGGCYTYFD